MEEDYAFHTRDGGRRRDSYVITNLYLTLDFQPRNVEIQGRLLEMWHDLGVEGNEIPFLSLLFSSRC